MKNTATTARSKKEKISFSVVKVGNRRTTAKAAKSSDSSGQSSQSKD